MKNTVKNGAFRTSGTNLRKAKSHNHSVVLEVIRTQGPISRTEIARVTSLSRQTIQNIVAQLEELKLVRMKTGKIVGRGHPGKEVSLNPESAHSIGVQLDRTRLTTVVCDLEGHKIWDGTREIESATPASANQAIAASVSEFSALHGDLVPTIVGCGIAAAGPFGNEQVRDSETTIFHEFGIEENLTILEDLLELPIVLENDATAGAVGESFYGAGRGLENFAYMQFGVGLGSGFILNGAPYSGTRGNAGELGHVIAELDGRPCPCGNRGCLERYLSIDALCQHLGLTPNDSETFDKIAALSKTQDPQLTDWIDEVAPRLHQAFSILESMMDPEFIIVGGTAPESFLDLLIKRAAPYPASLSGEANGDRIIQGSGGRLSIALGASAVSMNAHFAPSVSQLVL